MGRGRGREVWILSLSRLYAGGKIRLLSVSVVVSFTVIATSVLVAYDL